MFSLHQLLSFPGSEFLNGVSEGSAWHCGFVSAQERREELLVPFADFAEHPAYGLLHQVMLGFKEDFSKFYCVAEPALTYEHQC